MVTDVSVLIETPEFVGWKRAATRVVGGHRTVIDVKGGSRDEKRLCLCICVDCGSTWDEGGVYQPLCCAA